MLPYAPQKKVYKKQSASRRRRRGLSPENDDLSAKISLVVSVAKDGHSLFVHFIVWRGN